MSSPAPDFAALPLHRKLALGGSVLMLIALTLPWVSIMGYGANAWNSGLGTVIGILAIAVLVWEAIRLLGRSPQLPLSADLVTAIGSGLIALLTVVLFIDVINVVGFGAVLGLLVGLGFGYAAYLSFLAGGGRAAVDGLRNDTANDPSDPPPPPPA